jgi:hypothetical protein
MLNQRFVGLGWRVVDESPSDFASNIGNELVLWGQIIRKAGLRLEP